MQAVLRSYTCLQVDCDSVTCKTIKLIFNIYFCKHASRLGEWVTDVPTTLWRLPFIYRRRQNVIYDKTLYKKTPDKKNLFEELENNTSNTDYPYFVTDEIT